MSSDSQPITPARFRAALSDLSVDSLHAKAAEIRNSITHLQSSNEQLREYAMEGDKDCYEAMIENEEVIERMEHRISILKEEVEGRGLRWIEDHEIPKENGVNGEEGEQEHVDMPNGTADDHTANLNEDLRRVLAERMVEDDGDGVHL